MSPRVRTVASFVLASGACWYVLQGVDARLVLSALKGANPLPIALALLALTVAYGARGRRWQIVLTTVLGSYVYLTTPRSRRAPSEPAAAEMDTALLETTHRQLWALEGDIAGLTALPPPVAVSIVIPAYNEQNRLPKTVLEALRWCSAHLNDYEVIIVDDGSTDQTLAIAELLQDNVRHVRALACHHKGKGAAVRAGMLNARGHYVLFMDADGATPMSEIPKLLDRLDAGAHVAIGSRIAQHPGEVTIETSAHRRLVGRTFAAVVNLVAVSGIGDTQCGFKMFRHDVIKAIFGQQRLEGFAFDVEILYLARHLGLTIDEVPVNWVNQAGSKVNVMTDSLRMLWDTLHIRWIHRGSSPAVAVAQSARR
jgi:dolichyl-phosphate beta-glucosyltransferase